MRSRSVKMKQNQSTTSKVTKSATTGRLHNTICMIALTCILAFTGVFTGTKKV
jgi:predicted permease